MLDREILLTIHLGCFTDSNLSLPGPCVLPHKPSSCPPLTLDPFILPPCDLCHLLPWKSPLLLLALFGKPLFTFQQKVQMLPIHGIMSNLPPLLFYGDMYNLLFYSHYEPVSSTGNGSSGSGTVLFSLLYPQILITVVDTQEGSQNLLTACLWISRWGMGLGAHLLWLWAQGCGFRECVPCTARELCENTTHQHWLYLLNFLPGEKKPYTTGNPNPVSPTLECFLLKSVVPTVCLWPWGIQKTESPSPSLSSEMNLNICASFIPSWLTTSPSDVPQPKSKHFSPDSDIWGKQPAERERNQNKQAEQRILEEMDS